MDSRSSNEEIRRRLRVISSEHELAWILEEAAKHENPSARVEETLCRREKGEPLAYVFGQWAFGEREFFVGAGALIPRPETEELVEKALVRLPKFSSPLSVIDAGAGTGCIGLSIGRDAQVPTKITLIERSPAALPWLHRNVAAWGPADVFEGSWLDFRPVGPVHVLISNPPYVGIADRSVVDPSALSYEPSGALFPDDLSADPEARGPYRELMELAEHWLVPGGIVGFELGLSQGAWLLRFAQERGQWDRCELLKDMAGKDRFFFTVRR